MSYIKRTLSMIPHLARMWQAWVICGVMLVAASSAAVYAHRAPHTTPVTKSAAAHHAKTALPAAQPSTPAGTAALPAMAPTSISGEARQSVSATKPSTAGTLPSTKYLLPLPVAQVSSVTAASFVQVQDYCSGGYRSIILGNLAIYVNPNTTGFTLTWKWETTDPSVTYDHDDVVRSVHVSPGQSVVYGLDPSVAGPGIMPLHETDAYSYYGGTIPAHLIRAHVLSPNEAYTPWVSVPVFTSTGHTSCP